MKVKNTASYRDQATVNSLSNVRMSQYDRGLAEHYMAQGEVLADVMLRVMHCVRGLSGNTNRVLTGGGAQVRV